jgi:hypothetical protein
VPASASDIRALFERHVEHWNAGRFDEWIALWPDDVTMEDPVGTPVRTGVRACFVDPWKEFQGNFRLEITNLVVVGSEAALTVRNRGTIDGVGVITDSIELYEIGDGTLRGRVFYEAPAT